MRFTFGRVEIVNRMFFRPSPNIAITLALRSLDPWLYRLAPSLSSTGAVNSAPSPSPSPNPDRNLNPDTHPGPNLYPNPNLYPDPNPDPIGFNPAMGHISFFKNGSNPDNPN